jgi:CubicO group peptidase (beta-lactamase class C family)
VNTRTLVMSVALVVMVGGGVIPLHQARACSTFLLADGDAASTPIETIDGRSISSTDLDHYVTSVMDSAGVTGLQLAVINRGRVVYSNAYGLKSRRSGLAPDAQTVFGALSFSKTVFAYLVMQLVEDGVLDLDKPLFEYLPKPLSEYPQWMDLAEDDRYKQITARLALSHSTGLPNSRAFMQDGKLRFVYDPGARFHYSGEGINYLQFVVETVSGERLDQFAKKRVFVPLGMTRSSFVWEKSFNENHAIGHTESQRTLGPLRWGTPGAAGSMVTTASDYARLLVAILNADGLSADRVGEMLTSQIAVTSKREFGPQEREDTGDNKKIDLGWGLGWGRFDTEQGRAFFHTGHTEGWENYTVTYLDRKIGIVLISNSANFESVAQRIVEFAIGDHDSPFVWLGYEPFDPSSPPPDPEPERQTIPIDPAIFDAVVGRYEVAPGDYVFLKMEDGRLLGSGEGTYWADVFAVSENQFFIDGRPYDFRFDRNSEGTVTGMTILFNGMEIPAKKVQ